MTCRIQTVDLPEIVLIQVVGDSFALQSIQEMRNVIQQLLEKGLDRPVAICTDGLCLLGSSCLSGIIDVAFQLRKRGTPAFVAEAREDAKEVFEVASLSAILPVYDTIEEGIEALKTKRSV